MVHAAGVFRSTLSILQACYAFAGSEHEKRARVLLDEVIAELQVFCALLLTFHGDLWRSILRTAFMSVSSLKKYAVHSAVLDIGECKRLGSVQERWRFKGER